MQERQRAQKEKCCRNGLFRLVEWFDGDAVLEMQAEGNVCSCDSAAIEVSSRGAACDGSAQEVFLLWLGVTVAVA